MRVRCSLQTGVPVKSKSPVACACVWVWVREHVCLRVYECVSVCVYAFMRALVCLVLGDRTPTVASFRHPPGASDTCLARNFSNFGTGNIMSRIAPWVHPVGRFGVWRGSGSTVDSSSMRI